MFRREYENALLLPYGAENTVKFVSPVNRAVLSWDAGGGVTEAMFSSAPRFLNSVCTSLRNFSVLCSVCDLARVTSKFYVQGRAGTLIMVGLEIKLWKIRIHQNPLKGFHTYYSSILTCADMEGRKLANFLRVRKRRIGSARYVHVHPSDRSECLSASAPLRFMRTGRASRILS